MTCLWLWCLKKTTTCKANAQWWYASRQWTRACSCWSCRRPQWRYRVVWCITGWGGVVDTFDEMCSYQSCSRINKRWPLTFFYVILNAAVFNSEILYKQHIPQNTLKRRFFQEKLALSLIELLAQRRLANLCCLPFCGPPSTAHFLIWCQRYWSKRSTTAHSKTLPNLPSVAPKQDEFRVPEVWNSYVQGTLSNLLPRLLKGRSFMQFVFCCAAHFNVATVLHKLNCLQELRVQVFSPVTLVRRKVKQHISLSIKPCCAFAINAATPSKLCRHYIFEITFLFLFWSILCSRLADIVVINLPSLGKTHLMCKNPHKYHKNNKFSCLNLIHFFACSSASFEHITMWTLCRTPMKATGGISDDFVYFSCRLQTYRVTQKKRSSPKIE